MLTTQPPGGLLEPLSRQRSSDITGQGDGFLLIEAGMTVAAACLAARVSRRFYNRWLPRWQAAREARLEHTQPGGVVHLDTRSSAGSSAGGVIGATGDRRARKRGAGWEVLHVALDDATRRVYAPRERRIAEQPCW